MTVKNIYVINNIAFIILYCLCFYAVSNSSIQFIGYGILFVIHSAFILFFIQQLFPLMKTTSVGMIEMLVLFSILVSLISHFIDFILIISTFTYLRTKYHQQGKEMNLDLAYQNILNSFSPAMFSVFGVCTVLLFMFFCDITGMNMNIFGMNLLSLQNIKNYLKEPKLESVGLLVFPLVGIVFSIGVLYVCYLEFQWANTFSKLYSRDISKAGLSISVTKVRY